MLEVTLTEAAQILSCSIKTIRRKIHAGQISARLVSGHKGPEYRILLAEPEKSTVDPPASPARSVGGRGSGQWTERQNPQNVIARSPEEFGATRQSPKDGSTHFEKLYRETSGKYEQALMLIGRLQAELDKKLPQLEAEASSLKEKYDLLKLQHDEKQHKIRDHEQSIQTKEYVIAELAKELDNAHAELKRHQSPLYFIKKLFRFS